MHIVHIQEVEPSRIYGIMCRSFFPDSDARCPPFGSMFCTVAPKETATRHNHHEYECFYICSGSGQIVIAGETQNIGAGDAIFIPAFQNHSISNQSNDTELQFLTFWWEDTAAMRQEKVPDTVEKTTLIFTAPPTPNGDLHLGHLSGPFTGADIYRRYLRLQGVSAYHCCGRDDHQSYVVRKAMQEKRSPTELADDNSVLVQKTLKAAGIILDHFHNPKTSQIHTRLTQQAFSKLYAEGYIYAKEVDTAFCKETGKYLHEAYIGGTCPHCGEETDGNACEQCGQPNDCVDLITPYSKYGSLGIELRKTKRLFFKLSAFADRLRAYHDEAVMPAHLASLCVRMLSQGLPDICVAHQTDWGIPVPLQEFKDQRIYVWFEMAFGYLSSAQELNDEKTRDVTGGTGWQSFYSNASTRIVHFFGFDNAYFHALLLPAIYMAFDSNIRLPEAYIVNEFLSLDNSKFSTSRNHLIWGRDLLAATSSDYVRFYLSYIRPETRKNNFTLDDFQAVINAELAGQWQDWLNALFDCATSVFGNVMPEPGAWTVTHKNYFDRLMRQISEAQGSYTSDDFSPQRVCRIAIEVVREARRLMDNQEYLRQLPEKYNEFRTGFALQVLTAKALAVIMAPIMPVFADKLWQCVAHDSPMLWNAAYSFAPGKTKLIPPHDSFFVPVSTDKLAPHNQ